MQWVATTQDSRALAGSIHASGSFRATTPDGGLVQEIESIITSAKDGDLLRLISPVIDDQHIVRLLVEAREQGVAVRVLTSLSDRGGKIVTKGWDASQDVALHDEAIRTLAQAGATLRSPWTTPHGKMVHLREERAIFGSANLTKGSLRKVALEAAVAFEDQTSLSGTGDAFDRIWKSSPYLMKRTLAGTVTLEERSSISHGADAPSGSQWFLENTECLLSAPTIGTMTERLTKLISGAQSKILLVALSLYETDAIPNFGAALTGALARGVRVSAVVRPEHFKPHQYPDPATLDLLRRGLKLTGVSGLHAKGFLIDDQWCGIQSANFNPYSLDNQRPEANWETALIGPAQSPLLHDFAGFIQHLACHPTHEFV